MFRQTVIHFGKKRIRTTHRLKIRNKDGIKYREEKQRHTIKTYSTNDFLPPGMRLTPECPRRKRKLCISGIGTGHSRTFPISSRRGFPTPDNPTNADDVQRQPRFYTFYTNKHLCRTRPAVSIDDFPSQYNLKDWATRFLSP